MVVYYLIGWRGCLDVCAQLQLGGGGRPGSDMSRLLIGGAAPGGWGFVGLVWAALSVWGGPALVCPGFLLVGRLGFVSLDWFVGGSAAVTVTTFSIELILQFFIISKIVSSTSELNLQMLKRITFSV